MTVRELIKELEELPLDLPVVNDYKEISGLYCENVYYLVSSDEYDYSSAIVLR